MLAKRVVCYVDTWEPWDWYRRMFQHLLWPCSRQLPCRTSRMHQPLHQGHWVYRPLEVGCKPLQCGSRQHQLGPWRWRCEACGRSGLFPLMHNVAGGSCHRFPCGYRLLCLNVSRSLHIVKNHSLTERPPEWITSKAHWTFPLQELGTLAGNLIFMLARCNVRVHPHTHDGPPWWCTLF